MTPIQLARAMARLRLTMEDIDGSEPGPEFGLEGLITWTKPEVDTPFPSSNPNKVELDGDRMLSNAAPIEELVRRYRGAGSQKFFFWVDPLWPDLPVEEWLTALGLTRFEGTTYPVLMRKAERVELPATDFRIERVLPGREIEGCYGNEAARKRFKETIGRPGFEHFVAWDGDKPVGSARLFVHEGLAYLNDGGTLEEYRNRGAQSALIAARVSRAAELGCSHCCVYTLRFLETSLGNLKRGGFEEVYEREVWQWTA